MQVKVLPPRMQHREESDPNAQTCGVGGNREQRFRRGAKQDAVNLARILKRQPADLLRQRKHDVEIPGWQQVGFPCRQPLGARHGLALWAMSVAA